MMGFWRVSDDKWKNLGQDLLRELSSWVSTASACLALVIKLEEGREGGLADIWVRPFVCISSAATRLHVKATVASGSQPMTHGVFTLHLSGSLPFIEEGFPECEWRSETHDRLPAMGIRLRANGCLQGEEEDQGIETGLTQRICVHCLQYPS